jgi:uncharacterized membrane protein HdeD (DUF308 family)
MPWPFAALLLAGLALLVGAVLLWAPAGGQAATWLLLSQFLGSFGLVCGLLDLGRLATDRAGWGRTLLIGLPSVLAGGALLVCPLTGAGVLPSVVVLVLGGWGLAYGGLLLLLAVRGGGWGAGVLGGVGIILGLMLVVNHASVRL